MSKYSLKRLMEADMDDNATFSIGKVSYDLVLTPLTKSVKEIIDIINDPKNYKGSFIKDPASLKQAKENYFGITIPPAVKSSMEKSFSTLSKEEWIEKNKKYKDLEKKYETLSNNNGKFHFFSKDANTAFEAELNYTPSPKDLVPNVEGKTIRFIPNTVLSIGKIERSLKKVLNNANLKEKTDYTISTKEAI
jgi:hypothetical protein